MIRKHATVRNAAGIHCRPSAVIVTEALAYAGEAWVECEAGKANLRSILELVSLGLMEHAQVVVCVQGRGEKAFCARLVELFERHFDFPQLTETDKSKAVPALMEER